MDRFLSPILADPPFQLFGVTHIWTMVGIAIAGAVIVAAGTRGDYRLRSSLRWLMVGIFAFWQVEWHVWNWVAGEWSVQRQLPLHLCGIMILVTMYGLASRDRRVYPLIYFFGIAGSVQAIITPEAIFDFPHIRFLNTMVSHGLLVIGGFWIVFVERYRPSWKDLVASLVILNAYALVVYFINVAIGANYLFVVHKPTTASLLDVFPEWPWYILFAEVMAVAIFTAMCWPFNRGARGSEIEASEPVEVVAGARDA